MMQPLQNVWQFLKKLKFKVGFPGGSDGKASACNAGDPGFISGLARYPGEENDNPLQYSCLENSIHRRRGALQEGKEREIA